MSLDGPLERLLALEQLAGTVNERLLEVQTRLELHVDAYVYELAANPTFPKLRDAGVIYAPDPVAEFAYSSIAMLLQSKRADAEELGAWRAAELRMQGAIVELQVMMGLRPSSPFLILRRGAHFEDPLDSRLW